MSLDCHYCGYLKAKKFYGNRTQSVFRSNRFTVSKSNANQSGQLEGHAEQNELNVEGKFTCDIDPRDNAKLVKIIGHKYNVPGLLNGMDVSLMRYRRSCFIDF